MKRRTFLQSSVAQAVISSAALAGFSTSASARDGSSQKHWESRTEYYELRTYTLNAAKKPMLDTYLSKAYIPALRRAGTGPVGVFTENLGGEKLAVHVLIVVNSANEAAILPTLLATDGEYAKAAADYLAAPASDPVYERIESSFLGAIEGFPHLVKPATAKPRLLNLRIYESHNERAAAKKVEMFNKHELAIFQRVGLTPVFFAEALGGSRMPNLTYMLVFPDEAGRTAAWNRFRTDDAWVKLKAIPEYADKEIVSRITNKVLPPEPYSEI
jgi:hypothetical protein